MKQLSSRYEFFHQICFSSGCDAYQVLFKLHSDVIR